MRLNIINFNQAESVLGQDVMIEIMTCLERNDDQAIDDIMVSHPELNYVLFWVGERRDIIFIMP